MGGLNSRRRTPQVTGRRRSVVHYCINSLSLLGRMAKIKCSICSYQFNIWYVGHVSTHILIWFLLGGQGSEVYLTLTTGCIGIALPPRAAHPISKANVKTQTLKSERQEQRNDYTLLLTWSAAYFEIYDDKFELWIQYLPAAQVKRVYCLKPQVP